MENMTANLGSTFGHDDAPNMRCLGNDCNEIRLKSFSLVGSRDLRFTALKWKYGQVVSPAGFLSGTLLFCPPSWLYPRYSAWVCGRVLLNHFLVFVTRPRSSMFWNSSLTLHTSTGLHIKSVSVNTIHWLFLEREMMRILSEVTEAQP